MRDTRVYRERSPQRLGSVLGQLISDLNIGKRLDVARVIDAWGECAGPGIASVTDKAWFRKGTLYVKINSSAWRQELHFGREEWKRKVNEVLGEELVRELVFR